MFRSRAALARLGLFHSAASAALLWGAGAAWGQAATSPPVESASDSGRDVVVVTALKRDGELLEAPAAISSFSGDTLEERNIVSLADLSMQSPSLNTGEAGGVSYVSIRGVSINSTTGAIENPVAVHIDGVYLAQSTSFDFLMLDVDAVEVLRGPQGTLYGRNSTGGSINYTTAKPTDTFEAAFDVGIGNYNSHRATGVVSGPIAAGLSGRLAVLSAGQGDGYFTNLATGRTLGPNSSTGWRGALRFEPTDSATFDLSAYAYTEDNDGILQFRRNPLNAKAKTQNPLLVQAREYADIRHVYLDGEPHAERTLEGATLTGAFDLSDAFSLKSISSFSESSMGYRNVDTDGTDIALGLADRMERVMSYQQEVDLTFDLFDDRLKGLVGVFFDHERLKLDSVLKWLPNSQGFVSVGPIIPVNTSTVSHFNQTTKTSAIFTDLSYDFGGPLSVYGGYRVSRDERDLTLTTGLDGLPGNVGLTCLARDFNATFNSQTGKLGVKYDLDGAGAAYAQAQEGFKAGGFNPFGCNDTYEPEQLTSYEAGYKTELFDGQLTLALAAFYYDYANLQVAQIVNNSTRIDNAASATNTGLEVEAGWRLTPDIRADVAMAFMDGKYEQFTDLDTLNAVAGFQNLSGNPLNRTPDFAGTVGLEGDFAVGDLGSLHLRGEVFNSSRLYFRPFGADADSQASYTLLNAYAGFTPAGTNVDIRAFVKNATNEAYLTGLFSAGLFADRWATYGAPRTYGISVSTKF